MWVQSSHREGRDEGLGFASRRRHLLPGPPTRPRRSCGGGSQLSPGRGRRHLGPSPCSAPQKDAGRRGGGCGRRAEWGADGEAAVAARSRRFPVPEKLSTAAAAAAAAAGSAHVSPPAPAPSSPRLSPPPPPALSSSFPPSCQSSPEPSSAPSQAGRLSFAALGPAIRGREGTGRLHRGHFHLDAECLWVFLFLFVCAAQGVLGDKRF